MGRLLTATKNLLLSTVVVIATLPTRAAPPVEAAEVHSREVRRKQRGDAECFEPGPLLVVPLDTVILRDSTEPLGQWPLPLSPTRPDLLTEAQLKVELVRTEKGEWSAVASFTFNDPKPYGLPFTFQKIQLSWTSNGTTYTADKDWSNACEAPGVSLFPGQDRSIAFDLLGAQDQWVLENPVLRLWGSRN